MAALCTPAMAGEFAETCSRHEVAVGVIQYRGDRTSGDMVVDAVEPTSTGHLPVVIHSEGLRSCHCL